MSFIPNYYNRTNLIRSLRNPSMVRGELTRWGMQANAAFHRRFGEREGVAVAEEDWDNLLVLDACRYDAFAKTNDISGTLESKTSLGSNSGEFMERNFGDGVFHDTVYVSGNPYISLLDEDTFHSVRSLFADEWDEERGTVMPETAVDAALQAHHEFTDKRLIVHFMQPHAPFIGETGRRIPHIGDTSTTEKLERTPDDEIRDVWTNLRYGFGDTDITTVRKAYAENLEIVLEAVETLLDDLSGRSVVTADHGELLGERLQPVPVRGYGHPDWIRAPELVEVPWLVVESGERREVTAEAPETTEFDDEIVDDRLAALGYV